MKLFTSAVLLLCILLSACSGDNEGTSSELTSDSNAGVAVMSYEGHEISSGLYAYILSVKKGEFLELLNENYGDGYAADTEAFWNSAPYTDDTRTYSELVLSDIDDYCRMLLVAGKLCGTYSVELNDRYLDEISLALEDNVLAYGGNDKLNDFLKRFGMTSGDLGKYYESQYQLVALTEAFYGDDGIFEIDPETVNAAIKERYVKLKHIYYAGEDKEALRAKAEEIIGKISVGEASFEEYHASTEDDSFSSYPDGSVFTKENYDAAGLNVAIGGLTTSETDDGIYIIYRIELSKNDLSEYYEAVESILANDEFYDRVSQYFDLVELNNEELGKYDIITAEIIE